MSVGTLTKAEAIAPMEADARWEAVPEAPLCSRKPLQASYVPKYNRATGTVPRTAQVRPL